eukprot:m.111894 g.111894  ORF g.111894 m.111894 type:complete len:115 (-) comp15401_c0_seq7:3-347(-)
MPDVIPSEELPYRLMLDMAECIQSQYLVVCRRRSPSKRKWHESSSSKRFNTFQVNRLEYTLRYGEYLSQRVGQHVGVGSVVTDPTSQIDCCQLTCGNNNSHHCPSPRLKSQQLV